MKLPFNSSFINVLLTGNRQWIIGHLFTFTSASGLKDYFTDLDADVNYGGNVYKSGSLRIQGLRMKLAVGVNVDEQEVVIWASLTDTLFGGNFLTGMAEGIMDGGTIARDRIVWANNTNDVSQDILQPPVAVWRMFLGYMSTIDKLGRGSVNFKMKSPLVKLNIQMPRNFYQPDCGWSLFDEGCTLEKANFVVLGVVGSPTNEPLIRIPVSGGVSPNVGADSLPYFQGGRIVFTSGVNDGLETTLDSNDAQALYVAYPLSAAPAPGDTFNAYPGCSKTFQTCQLKFNNLFNIRAFDKVPPVFVAV